MGGSPLQELFVLCEHGVDHLIEYVLGRLAEKVRVRVQRFVVLTIKASPMFDKLLAASSRLDQRHTCFLPGKNGHLVEQMAVRGPRHDCGLDVDTARSRCRLS